MTVVLVHTHLHYRDWLEDRLTRVAGPVGVGVTHEVAAKVATAHGEEMNRALRGGPAAGAGRSAGRADALLGLARLSADSPFPCGGAVV